MSFEIAPSVAGSDLNSDNTVLDVNYFMLIWLTIVHKNNFFGEFLSVKFICKLVF